MTSLGEDRPAPTSRIVWVEADKSHQEELKAFRCTTDTPRGPDGRRLAHPRQYELVVQSGIRNARPPMRGGTRMQLGHLSGALAAVTWFEFDDTEAEVFIKAVAIAVEQRGGDGQLAEAAMSRVVIEAARHFAALGHHSAIAVGKIHVENRASQRLAARVGFTADEMADDQLQFWVYDFSW